MHNPSDTKVRLVPCSLLQTKRLIHLQVCAYMHAQLCPTFCDPLDSGPPGSYVHGIFLPRILELVAISFSSDLPDPRIEPTSPTSTEFQMDPLSAEPLRKPLPGVG